MATVVTSVSGSVYGRIYCITNTVNGKKYVGQTVKSLAARWRAHKRRTGGCRALSNAIKKYGAAEFTVHELDTAESQKELDSLEILWIRKLGTISPNGYNLNIGGGGFGPFLEETKEVRRQAMRRRWKDPDFIERQRAGVLNAWRSPEFIAKNLAAQRSPETRAKRLLAAAKRWESPENRERHRAITTLAVNDPDVIKRQREHSKMIWASPGHREKMAEIMARPCTKQRLAETNSSDEVKKRRSESAKKMWQREGHREKVATSRARHYASYSTD